jgi:hypothetical protein
VGETGHIVPKMAKTGRPQSHRGADVKDICVAY